MVIGAPSDEKECRQMLQSAWLHEGPSAVRYPRGEGTGISMDSELTTLEMGKAQLIRQGANIAILNFWRAAGSGLGSCRDAERHSRRYALGETPR